MTRTPPYDSWARYYDLTDADRTPYIGFYGGLLRAGTRSLLELGCGTGTVARALARPIQNRAGDEAVRIAGVDESPEMLRIARSRAPEFEWVLGDMRWPPIRGPFDLVICPFNTLQLLQRDVDLKAAFQAVEMLLADGGRFAFDVYQPNLDYLRTPQKNRMARAIVDPDGRSLEIREDTSYESSSRLLGVRWRLVDSKRPEQPPIAETKYFVRQYFPPDIDRLLAETGLAVSERFGDLAGSPFGPESKKQVLVCRRH